MLIQWRKLERSLLRPALPSERYLPAVEARFWRRAALDGLAEDGIGISELELLTLPARPIEHLERRRQSLTAQDLWQAIERARSRPVAALEEKRATAAAPTDHTDGKGGSDDDALSELLDEVDALLRRERVARPIPLSRAAAMIAAAVAVTGDRETSLRALDTELAAVARQGDLRGAALAWATFLMRLERDWSEGLARGGSDLVHLRRFLRPGIVIVAEEALGVSLNIPPIGRGASEAFRSGGWEEWLLKAWPETLERFAPARTRFERFDLAAARLLGRRGYMATPFLVQPALSAPALAARLKLTERSVYYALNPMAEAGLLRAYPRDASWRVWCADALIDIG